MPKISSFRDLVVWQKAMALAERGYRCSKQLPRDDQLVLGHQIRKSCVSVPSNIAEGFGRHSTAEYIHHLRFSKGSVNELQTQLELARRLRVVPESDTAVMISDAEEMRVSGISCVGHSMRSVYAPHTENPDTGHAAGACPV